MSGIKRWDIDCHSMEWMEIEDGDMLKFSDHAAEIARLRAELEGYMMGAAAEAREVDSRGEEIKRLRAELDNAAAAAVRNMSLACEKEREADALRAKLSEYESKDSENG